VDSSLPLDPEDVAGVDVATAIAEAPAEPQASSGRAVKSVLTGSLLLQALAMISGVELARGLGLTGRGDLAAAILWPTMIGSIGVLGLEESVTFHVASARDRGDVGRLLGSALTMCAIQAAVFTVIALAVIPLALHKHTSTTIDSGLIFSGYVSINMFNLTLNGVLNGLHRYTYYNAVRVSIGVAIVVAQTILLVIGAFRVELIVTAMMGCYVLCLLFDFTLTFRARPGRLSVDRKAMRSIFLYGIKSHTSNTSSYLNQRLDQLVISIFLTARELGIYVVAVTFTLFTSLLGASVMVAALPNIARLETTAEKAALGRRFVSLTLLASIVASLPIIVLAPWLIKLFFGHAFAVGANITRVTAIASISFATTRVLEGVLRGLGRPLTAGTAEFVALGGTFAGLAALLPTLGLIGAAWATLVSYSISGLWMAWRIRVITGMPIRKLFVPDREALVMLRNGVRAVVARTTSRA
jgi:O-antigen/teichoic acid export membrane protein